MEHFDWYQHIRNNIGSVEESSFSQLENIQLCGQYSVGVAADFPFHSSQLRIQDVVQLCISAGDRPAVTKHYSLDELRDLESRLILVTSCDAMNRNKVDKFIHVRSIYYDITL